MVFLCGKIGVRLIIEEEHKPYRSRFPNGGNPVYAEDRSPSHTNIRMSESL